MDVVYPIGTGSSNDNKEIYYSLLSLRKFISGIDNIYLIGSEPSFNHGCIFIECPDNGKNKEDNIRRKVEFACNIPELSKQFLFCNDDFFFTRKNQASLVPYYFNSNLMYAHLMKRKKGQYKCAIENTYLALGIRDMPFKNFDIHYPIIYDKKEFPAVMRQYDWNKMHGYLIKSLYCNTLAITGQQEVDNKLFIQHENIKLLQEWVGTRWIFSIDDMAINDILWQYLKEIILEPPAEKCI